jgi:hypothetical protein
MIRSNNTNLGLLASATLMAQATAFAATAPTVTASVSPASVAQGQTTTLNWSSTNATSCSWFAGELPGTSGSIVQHPPYSLDYTVTCKGAGGSASKTVRVTVGETAEAPDAEPTTPPPTSDASAGSSSSAATFASSSYSVDQKTGAITVTVRKSGSAAGSVKYTTASGTAKGGTHYSIRQGTLSWAKGSTASKTVTIPIATKNLFSGTKSFTFNLKSPSGIAVGSPASTSITIKGGAGSSSSTPGTVTLGATTYSVSQNEGSEVVSIKRSNGNTAVTMSYTTVDGTAKAGTDYTTKSGTLSWAAGDTSAKSVSIAVSNAKPFSGSKTFSVKLTGGTGGVAMGSPNTATVTINGTGSSSGGGSTPVACSSSKAVWQSCSNWDARTYGKYWVRNNIWGEGSWGAGSQCMWAVNESCWGLTATHSNGNGIPKGYPQAIRGWAQGDGFTVPNSGMGIKVTDLTKAKIHWTMDAPTGGRYMALWDIYFHSKANPAGGETPRTSLMINQRIADDGYYAGQVANCPQGGGACPTVTWGGHTFRLWVGKESWASGNTIQLFLTPTSGSLFGSETMTLDLKAVIDGLRKLGYIPDSDYLTSIQNGWEIIDGGTFQTSKYWTALQGEPDPE